MINGGGRCRKLLRCLGHNGWRVTSLRCFCPTSDRIRKLGREEWYCGSYNVGLFIGNLGVIFHPGYSSGSDTGAARIGTWDGTYSGFNKLSGTDPNMGFTPAQGSVYTTSLTISEDAAKTHYLVDYTISDSSHS